MISLQNICKTYNNGVAATVVLKDVTVKVEKGEIYCVIGKSGAGKSTLLRCVNLLESVTSGCVAIDDVELATLLLPELRTFRKRIGIIFQHFNLLESRTVWGNIALPLELLGYSKAQIKAEVEPLLALVHLEPQCSQYPSQLSGGQKQRVAIARALATKPDLLLCDEPTSALDPESTREVIQLLKQINRDMQLTMLWVTHEMDVVKVVADRVGVMDCGMLVEEGAVVDIFSNPQQSITRRLTQLSLREELPDVLRDSLQEQPQPGLSLVIRLLFTGGATQQPILLQLQKKIDISVNIVQANLDHVGQALMGFVVCQLIGDDVSVRQALVYLQQRDVTIEELGYA